MSEREETGSKSNLVATVEAVRAEREARPEWPIIRKLYEAERRMAPSGARELVREATVELELLSTERASHA